MITLTGAEKAFVKIQCQLMIKIPIKIEIHEDLLNLIKNIKKTQVDTFKAKYWKTYSCNSEPG